MEPAPAAAAKVDDVADEKRWLISTYIPLLLPVIKAAISEALELLSFPAHSVKLTSLKSADGSIHGAYRMSGTVIMEAEISIRHAPEKRTASPTYRTEINTSHPYHLHQLQDATNHVNFALAAIDELSSAPITFFVAQKIFKDILNRLKSAAQSINSPSPRCFPSTISPQCVLFPPLPQDVLLEFSLHNHRLITRSYLLSITNKPRASAAQAPRTEGSGWLNQTIKYRDLFVEVISVATAETEVSDLDRGLAALERASEHCRALLDNLNVLQCLSPEET